MIELNQEVIKNQDIIQTEIDYRLKLQKTQDSPEYFQTLSQYYGWLEERKALIKARKVNPGDINKAFESYLKSTMQFSDSDLQLERTITEYKESLPVDFTSNTNPFEYTTERGKKLAGFVDYSVAFLNLNLPLFRDPAFETLFLLRNLKSAMENSNLPNAKKRYEEEIGKLADSVSDEIFYAGSVSIFSRSTTLESLVHCSPMDSDASHVKGYSQKDPYLIATINDLRNYFREKVVVKGTRKIKKDEFGIWIDSDKSTRLEREATVLRYLNTLDIPISFPRVTGYDEKTGTLEIEKIDGISLKEANDPELIAQFIKLLPFLQKRLSHDYKLEGTVFNLDLQEEFKIIKEAVYLSYSSEEKYSKVQTLLESWLHTNRTFCHGSLHPGQVIFKDGQFYVIDFELANFSFPQDDLVRIMDGPVRVTEEQREQNLANFFAITSATRDYFAGKTTLNSIIDYDYEVESSEMGLYEKFLTIYYLRRGVMHLWATSFMATQRKSFILAEEQKEFAIDSFRSASNHYQEYLDIQPQPGIFQRLFSKKEVTPLDIDDLGELTKSVKPEYILKFSSNLFA